MTRHKTRRDLRRSVALGVLAIAGVIAYGTARAASPASDPHVVIRHEIWKSSGANCTADIEHASVMGVPPEVKARSDGILEQQLQEVALRPSWRASRESHCAQAIRDGITYFGGVRFHGFNNADWTVGLTHARWISVRLHVEQYSGAGQAHPTDFYTSTTFDLRHDGYPVPTSGYFLKSQRARFDDALTSGWFALMKRGNPPYRPNVYAVADVHGAIASAVIDQRSIMLATGGIDDCGLGFNEATRTVIVDVPYEKLTGVGTPGGPLDPATR
jgi:hypothetical protein